MRIFHQCRKEAGYLPSIPEEEVFNDVRCGQHDAEGDVDGEGVLEQRSLTDPDEGLRPVHVEIPTYVGRRLYAGFIIPFLHSTYARDRFPDSRNLATVFMFQRLPECFLTSAPTCPLKGRAEGLL